MPGDGAFHELAYRGALFRMACPSSGPDSEEEGENASSCECGSSREVFDVPLPNKCWKRDEWPCAALGCGGSACGWLKGEKDTGASSGALWPEEYNSRTWDPSERMWDGTSPLTPKASKDCNRLCDDIFPGTSKLFGRPKPN